MPAVLAAVPSGFDVIVVDNGSTDGTAAVAARFGARVIVEPRAGYGAAVHAGVEAATTEYVAVMDGDCSMNPAALVPMLAAVVAGTTDLAVGRRRAVGARAWPWHARAGNVAVLAWLRRRTGLAVTDIAPMRVARRAPLLDLGITDRRFGYPVELLVKAQQAGWRITEQDIEYRPRAAGTRSKVSGSVGGTLRTVRDFAKALP